MLYHVTPSENVPSIREKGLLAADNTDAVDPLTVAEETRDRLLDQYARATFGEEYQSRRHSVFFYSDPVFAVTEGIDSDAAVVVVAADTLETTLFSANRDTVEDLYATIREGVLEDPTNPTYDTEAVTIRAKQIATSDFRRWDGTADADREVWGAGRVRPDSITAIWK